jgi:hypothetical protein
MQVNANIDEADVGRIRPNQNVTFRVDAYPGEEFQGSVSQIRLQPVVVQNVTTYATIINVPNPELKLKPGMTANLRVQIARRADVLRVANAAMRFRPTAEIFAALNQPVPPEALGGRGGRGGNTGGRRSGDTTATAPGAPRATGAPQASAAPQAGATPAPSGDARAPRADGGQRNFNRGDGGRAGFDGSGFGGRGEGGFGGGGGFSGRGQGGFGGPGGADGGDRQARMLERFKGMSSDEQKQFIDRIKGRGGDTSAFEKSLGPATKSKSKGEAPMPAAATIDALFAPLPTVERPGRAWLYVDKQLKSVNFRTGITDGTNTELVSGDLQVGAEVVTGIVLPTAARAAAGAAGNPLLQQGGRGQGGFPGGGNFGNFGGGGGGRGR